MRPSDPTILAFDTSAAHCAAAVLCGGTIRAARTALMARGQAEHLMPMLEDLLAGQGLAWRDLAAVAVGTGPGNFTGIRIAVAAARGLALGLGVPAVGVSLFEVLLSQAPSVSGDVVVSLEAPRGAAYVLRCRDGQPVAAPRLIDPAAPPDDMALARDTLVLGWRAAEIARPWAAMARDAMPTDLPERIALCAAGRLARATDLPRPAPLYVRPADAAPPSSPPPVILP